MVHPGDSASPLEIIEWLDCVDDKLDATSYGTVRRGDIPAKLLRETEPIDISVVMPPHGSECVRSAADHISEGRGQNF